MVAMVKSEEEDRGGASSSSKSNSNSIYPASASASASACRDDDDEACIKASSNRARSLWRHAVDSNALISGPCGCAMTSLAISATLGMLKDRCNNTKRSSDDNPWALLLVHSSKFRSSSGAVIENIDDPSFALPEFRDMMQMISVKYLNNVEELQRLLANVHRMQAHNGGEPPVSIILDNLFGSKSSFAAGASGSSRADARVDAVAKTLALATSYCEATGDQNQNRRRCCLLVTQETNPRSLPIAHFFHKWLPRNVLLQLQPSENSNSCADNGGTKDKKPATRRVRASVHWTRNVTHDAQDAPSFEFSVSASSQP